jgi:hypothetical protein
VWWAPFLFKPGRAIVPLSRNDVIHEESQPSLFFRPSGQRRQRRKRKNGRALRSRIIIITPRTHTHTHTDTRVLIQYGCSIYRLEARLRLTTGATRVYLASSCCRTIFFPGSLGYRRCFERERERGGGREQEVIDCLFGFCIDAGLFWCLLARLSSRGYAHDDSLRGCCHFSFPRPLMMMDGGVTNTASVRFTLSSA